MAAACKGETNPFFICIIIINQTIDAEKGMWILCIYMHMPVYL